MKEIRRITITTTRRLRLSEIRVICPVCGGSALQRETFFHSRHQEPERLVDEHQAPSLPSEGVPPSEET